MNAILLYCSKPSPRLRYISAWLFEQVAGCSLRITSSHTEFAQPQDVLRINYSNEVLQADVHWIPSGFLFETGIHPFEVPTSFYANKLCLFPVHGGHWGFDILSALFFCISRYEEYTTTQRDVFGRFPHTASWAFQQGVLDRPLADEWINDLFTAWKKQFPNLLLTSRSFQFIPTYDIDIAYSFKGKPWYKHVAAWWRGEFKAWFQWQFQSVRDPYDAYDEFDEWHRQYALQPIYFLLLSKGGPYNKNLPVHTSAMQHLIKRLKAKYTLGLHPSFCDTKEELVWMHEKQLLGEPTHTRQHYIRFTLPDTYRQLERLGFEHEYSMGYGSINGFRASTSLPFNWYDVAEERVSKLRVHPFCFMECNARFEQGLRAEEAAIELAEYEQKVRAVSGTLITIWHNFSLGTDKQWMAWKAVYVDFLARVNQSK